MKIAVIGATGTLGCAVVQVLEKWHEVLQVGKTRGQYQVDMTVAESVQAFFEKTGPLDAIIATTGSVHFGALSQMTIDQFRIGLESKLLGQVQLAMIGQHYLNDGGSITLTTGVLTDDPIRYGVNATTVNAAVEGFVRAMAIELPRGIRINAVSPSVLEESMDAYGAYFRGFEPVSAQRVALAYVKSVEGLQTGQVYRVV